VRVILPELGEGINKATVTYWYFQEGDHIKEGEDLVEISTDKATFNLPSPATGILLEIFYEEGDTVGVGEALAVIEEETE
jgi:pyruvate dehydrogenase E2 component (dihydrolipoamide acetyltransferase)